MSYEHFVNNYQRYLKSPRTMSEAFKDDWYCNAITKPKESDYSGIGAFLGAMMFVAVFGYCFYLTIK
jgi:hypothetical protein